MKKMKKIISSVGIVVLTAMFVGVTVFSADSGSINATVTASVVAMSVTTDGTVDYGVVAGSADTTSNGVNDTQTLTNTGTVPVNFEIKGGDSTGQPWTLGSAAGDATYAHKTCITNCDITEPSWTPLTIGYVALATGVASAGTTELDLQVTVPTSNSGTGEATLPVNIMAVDPNL